MDIDITIDAQISKIAAQVVAKEGVIRRTVKLTLAREFDTVLAAALGKDAKKTLALLEVGSISEATIPIDAITASGDLTSMGSSVHIGVLRGVQAKAKADTGEDGLPTSVKLEFEFDWVEDAWVFLGRNLSAAAQVTIRSLQLDNGIDKAQHQPVNRRGKRVSAEA